MLTINWIERYFYRHVNAAARRGGIVGRANTYASEFTSGLPITIRLQSVKQPRIHKRRHHHRESLLKTIRSIDFRQQQLQATILGILGTEEEFIFQ